MTSFGINEFARRQTKDSPFSYFDGSEEELLTVIRENFCARERGYREGVVIVPVCQPQTSRTLFYSGVCEVTEDTELRAEFSARRPGEAPFLKVRAVGGEKIAAYVTELVLYSREVLGGDATEGADWELISINARPGADPEPMSPMAMARNFLGHEGGTRATYTAEEFARAIVYWSRRALLT